MIISMIAAMANKRVIGADNQMPWHLPADLAHFKRVTMGKPVVMGRKTYASIGKALPGRQNLVISRQSGLTLPDAQVVNSCQAAIDAAQATDELMIIGGGHIYEQFLPQATRLYLTHIALDVPGDTCFPDYQAAGNWQLLDEQHHQADARNPHDYRFVTLERA